jgi:hypothetical protein
MSQKRQQLPQWLWVPIASALALVLPAAVAAGTHRLVLFASLGPTAVIAAQQPQLPSARAYNAFVGHMIGLGCGFAAVFAFGLSATPSVFMTREVTLGRAAAAVVALLVAALFELLLHAQHPPAASTTLLVALGSFHPTWNDTGLIVGGVALVTAGAELMRRYGLRASDNRS